MKRTAIILTGLLLTLGGLVGTAAAGPAPAAPATVVQPFDGTPTNCTFTTSRPEISRGDSGNAVRQAQCYLNDSLNPQNHTRLVVDGDFGGKTETAVVQFQRCMGLKDDGIIGVQTWPALQRVAVGTTWVCNP